MTRLETIADRDGEEALCASLTDDVNLAGHRGQGFGEDQVRFVERDVDDRPRTDFDVGAAVER